MEKKRVDWTVVLTVDSMDDSTAAKTAEWTDERMVEMTDGTTVEMTASRKAENWDIWMVEMKVDC